jgi:hypothetical protein
MTAAVRRALAADLKGYEISKGTIRLSAHEAPALGARQAPDQGPYRRHVP